MHHGLDIKASSTSSGLATRHPTRGPRSDILDMRPPLAVPMPDDWSDGHEQPITIPTGVTLTCRSWQTEAAYRMLHHNVHPDVAERPEELLVYGGSGRVARGWEAWRAIKDALVDLRDDETLLVQSGKPVGIIPSHVDAPRVLIANSNLVGQWATWDHFNELERAGLMMYGQMTAGSWIYIGTQGILQGTYETLAAAARTHFGTEDLVGRLFVTGGLGGMGGAQPLTATMLGGVCLAVEVEEARVDFRLRTRYVDRKTASLEEALAWCEAAMAAGAPLSVGLVANCADVLPELVARGVVPDLVSDQTSAHDPLNGYVPQMSLEASMALRVSDPDEHTRRSQAAMAVHVEAMCALQDAGSEVFDYGNNIREQAVLGGLERTRAFQFPGFVPAYVRPLFCEGKGPFRWVALSGDEGDIARLDDLVLKLFAEDAALARWVTLARERVAFQGLPSRICWLGLGERARFGLEINELVASGEVSAPIAIGRDHLDCGSVASPNRETEGMLDGTDAVADWPLLSGMANICGGASWVSMHHGGGVGIGYSQHSGMVVVADGTPEAARRLERVLTIDPLMGVFRHVDAGYDRAQETADTHRVSTPMAFVSRQT